MASTRACWYACAFSPARVEGSGESASKERLKLFADVNPSITSAAAAIFFARSTIVLVLCAMASFESEIRQQQLHTVRKIPYITTTLQICTSVFGLRIARVESASRTSIAVQQTTLSDIELTTDLSCRPDNFQIVTGPSRQEMHSTPTCIDVGTESHPQLEDQSLLVLTHDSDAPHNP